MSTAIDDVLRIHSATSDLANAFQFNRMQDIHRNLAYQNSVPGRLDAMRLSRLQEENTVERETLRSLFDQAPAIQKSLGDLKLDERFKDLAPQLDDFIAAMSHSNPLMVARTALAAKQFLNSLAKQEYEMNLKIRQAKERYQQLIPYLARKLYNLTHPKP